MQIPEYSEARMAGTEAAIKRVRKELLEARARRDGDEVDRLERLLSDLKASRRFQREIKRARKHLRKAGVL